MSLIRQARPASPRPGSPLVTRLTSTCLVLVTLLAAAIVVGVAVGPFPIGPMGVLAAIADGIGLGWLGDGVSQNTQVVMQIRLPRVIVAVLVGAALGIAGATMQAIFRNPLAEPGVIGISSGAATGAVAAIYFGWTALSRWVLPGAAFLGAAATMLAVFAVASSRRDRSPATLLMIGIAISAFLGAVISVMVATADTEDELRGIVFWLQGGLGARTWDHVRLVLLPILAAGAVIAAYGRDLNMLLLGDDAARSSGVDVERARITLLVLASLLTGAAVSVSGVIGFVGLVVPHAIRLVLGPDNRILLPASALGGASFLVLADVVARAAFSPMVLPVGIVTALFGAPVFLYLVLLKAGPAR